MYISSEPYSDYNSCIGNMKFVGVIILGVVALVVARVESAPSFNEGQVPGVTAGQWQEYYRDKRSQYPQYQYVSPCAAAAASAPIPALAPSAPYQLNIAPVHGYPQQYNYGAPHYRAVELDPEHEVMSYSDLDMMSGHIPMARYNYAAPADHPVYTPAATSSPVFGVFPNGNAGGCNVPLLFSCSPSVVQGHVVPSPQQHAAPDAYRGVNLAHHDAHESHELPTDQKHLTPAHDSDSHAIHQ